MVLPIWEIFHSWKVLVIARSREVLPTEEGKLKPPNTDQIEQGTNYANSPSETNKSDPEAFSKCRSMISLWVIQSGLFAEITVHGLVGEKGKRKFPKSMTEAERKDKYLKISKYSQSQSQSPNHVILEHPTHYNLRSHLPSH